MSILRLNEFRALPGRFEALVEVMRSICGRIRHLDGCEKCELLLKVADGEGADDVLVVVETWASVAAHKQAGANIDPAELKAVMALLAGPPSGRYYQPLA